MFLVPEHVLSGRLSRWLLIPVLLLCLPAYARAQGKAELFTRIEQALSHARPWKIESIDFDTISNPPIDKISLRASWKQAKINIHISNRVEDARGVFAAVSTPSTGVEGVPRKMVPGLGDENVISTIRGSSWADLHFRRREVVVMIHAPVDAARKFARLILGQIEKVSD